MLPSFMRLPASGRHYRCSAIADPMTREILAQLKD